MPQLDETLELLAQGNLQAALLQCQNLVMQNPTDAESQHLLGLIYAKQGDITAAVRHFKTAINLDPRQAIFHNNLSNAYKLLGDLDAATRHLHEALHIAPNNAESFNNLGSLYYTQGDIKNAIQQFEKAIRLNPNSWEAHYNLANCYIKQDMVLQAISHYKTVLNLNPAHSNAKLNLAMSYVIVHEYENALPLLIEAAKNNPQHAELQGHLAEAYLNLGQTDNALSQYEKAIALDNDRPAWHHNLATLYARTGQADLAKVHYTAALMLQPDNSTAQHMLNALNANPDIANAPPEYVKLLFDQYASYYNQHMTKNLHYNAPQLLRQAFSKFITPHTKQQIILDLGCGTGLCGIYFRDLASFFVGVDLSPNMLVEANKLGAYDALCCCNILQIIPGVNRGYFDIILAADVFAYVGDMATTFAMMQSALKSAGLLAFTIEEQTKNDKFSLQETGRFAYSQQYIDAMCKQFGFIVETNEVIVPRMQKEQPVPGRLYILRNS
ncbi:MAG TPA: tetratricopeptide repeat protein [Gammaproteobacteria bacterium]|nr:tetratricopeptide repeat protein [Gammaproteobacteria bacterium]